MLCRNPFVKNGMAFGCGNCLPCRVGKRREWTHRIMLESMLYSDNTIATLTYADENLTFNEDGLAVLVSDDLKNWLKRFRKAIEPHRIRYFAAGEYGDENWRPHFHVAIFNYPNCRHGISRYRTGRVDCCSSCDLVRDTWRFGRVDLIELSESSAQYTCGYVTKKMTDKGHPALKSRPPEFSRMSLKPGIGSEMIWDVASSLMEFSLEDRMDDVPSSLRHGSRVLPLGRYLTGKLRERVGLDKKAPQTTLDKIAQELRPLREAAFENSRSFKKEIVQAADQAVLNMETKIKLRRKRREL